MIKDSQKIKGFTTHLNRLKAEAEILKIQVSSKNKEYNDKLVEINKIQKEIDKLSSTKSFRVSEHAIVRYFERIKGFNIQEIEDEILSKEILEMSETLGGNGKYPNKKGYHVVMKDNCVVTIEN